MTDERAVTLIAWLLDHAPEGAERREIVEALRDGAECREAFAIGQRTLEAAVKEATALRAQVAALRDGIRELAHGKHSGRDFANDLLAATEPANG